MMAQTPATRLEAYPLPAGGRTRAVAALVVALVCLGVRWPLLSKPGFIQDQVYFLHWASLAERGGVAAVYGPRADGRPWCNYPPLYPYVLRSLASVYRTGTGKPLDNAVMADVAGLRLTAETAAASALFKMPAVIADAMTCALLVVWLSRRASMKTATVVAMLYGLMPAVIFDSAVWGQVDSIPTLFLLIALESVLRQRWTWAGAFTALAVLTKAQAVLIVPLIAIAALFSGRRAAGAAMRVVAGAAVVAVVLLAPLWSVRENVAKAYTDAAGYYPFMHLNGFSAWFLANPLTSPRLYALADHYRRDDVAILAGLTPRQLGFVSFGLVAGTLMVTVARARAGAGILRQAAAILPLAFMVLCTQMHERYLLPAMAMWAWAFVPTWRWWVGWLAIGAVAALNLLWVWEQPLVVPGGAALVTWTRDTHAGIATGAYCAVLLAIVLMMSLAAIAKRPRPDIMA